MDDHAHEQAVEHGHNRRFGGGEQTQAHTAQNDHRRNQAPGGFSQAAPEGWTWQFGFGQSQLVATRQPDGRNNQANTRQNAGEHTGRKQRRYGGLGHQHRVNNEGDGGGNQNVGGSTRAHNTGRKRTGIARAFHGADHDRAHGGGAGRAGAGNTAQEHGHANGNDGQHARTTANQRYGKVHQTAGHARAVKNGPHQHKHGNGQQRVFGQTGVKALRHGHQAKPVRIQVGHQNG